MVGWKDGKIRQIDCLQNTNVITTCSKVHSKRNILSFPCEHLLRKSSHFFLLFIDFAVVKEELMLLVKNPMFFTLSKLSQK